MIQKNTAELGELRKTWDDIKIKAVKLLLGEKGTERWYEYIEESNKGQELVENYFDIDKIKGGNLILGLKFFRALNDLNLQK